jgi:hypothetical protein
MMELEELKNKKIQKKGDEEDGEKVGDKHSGVIVEVPVGYTNNYREEEYEDGFRDFGDKHGYEEVLIKEIKKEKNERTMNEIRKQKKQQTVKKIKKKKKEKVEQTTKEIEKEKMEQIANKIEKEKMEQTTKEIEKENMQTKARQSTAKQSTTRQSKEYGDEEDEHDEVEIPLPLSDFEVIDEE